MSVNDLDWLVELIASLEPKHYEVWGNAVSFGDIYGAAKMHGCVSKDELEFMLQQLEATGRVTLFRLGDDPCGMISAVRLK